MKASDFIKKGSLLTLSATLLFAPISNANAEDYKLNNSVQVYDKAENAKNRKNTVKTYPKGKYIVYKKVNGMINITKVQGKPGAWINPKDNLAPKKNFSGNNSNVANNTDSDEKLPVKKLEYKLHKDVKGYINSDNAKSQTNSVTNVRAGFYYIFRQYNGMLNITKQKGIPGTWINPKSNRAYISKNNRSNGKNDSKDKSINVNNLDKNSVFNLNDKIDGYYSSDDAKAKKNKVTNVYSGKYYIYKVANGMLNITKQKNSAGVWINPKGFLDKSTDDDSGNTYVQTPDSGTKPVVIDDKKDKDSTDVVKNDSEYSLNEDVKGYFNAEDAKNKNDSVSTVKAGKYYIYKTYDSMINLTKQKGKPGTWINPSAAKVVETVKVKPSDKTDIKDVVDVVKDNSNKVYNKGDVYNLTEKNAGYIRATDAINGTNKASTVKPGEYTIYKVNSGMINITKDKGQPGSWINPK